MEVLMYIGEHWMEWLFTACLAGLAWGWRKAWKTVSSKLAEEHARNEAIAEGVQALLRDRLISEYNHALKKGYAHIYDKENFENMYKQYHNLGANGVMDDIRETYRLLPTEKEDKDEDKDRYNS